jgi:protein-disulfide isomerase
MRDVQSFQHMLIATVKAPATGIWHLELHGAGTYAVTAHVKSANNGPDLIRFAFVEPGGRPGHEGMFPVKRTLVASESLACEVSVSGPIKEMELLFVARDGSLIRATPIKQSAESDYVGQCTVPDVPFRAAIRGKDSNGAAFQRIESPLRAPASQRAQTKDVAPCAMTLAAKITPCAQPSSDVPADVVATLDDAPIRLADLGEATRKKIEGLDSAVAAARSRALREEIDDILLAREAARRGITTGRLIYDEVIVKTTRPTEADVAREIAGNPTKYQSGAADSEWAAGTLFDRRMALRERELIATLEKRFHIKHSPGAHVAVAEADARIDALTDEKDAVDRVVQQRLAGGSTEGHTIHLLFAIPERPAVNVIDARAPATGPNNAPVTLVEWGDFQCPPCGRMAGVIEDVLRSHGDRVRYIFRQNPLSMHPHAWKAAEAALAAHAQGKFFPYAHILFSHQDQLDVASLKKYAVEAGLDTARFEHDLDSGRFAGDVASDKHLGARAGVKGTPVFFINGVKGGDEVYTLEGMRGALDAAAMRAKK